MTKIKSPTQANPIFLIPVNPAIEEYMLSLSGSSDHPVLDEMEKLAQKHNFPIVGRSAGSHRKISYRLSHNKYVDLQYFDQLILVVPLFPRISFI